MARQSKIIIAKNIKIDKEYKEVLNYSENDMLSLVTTNKVDEASDYSFIRDTGVISTHFSYSDCLKCNYMAFQNKDYNNKWFFAFIDDIKYISDGVTQISYTVDAWSTWYSKLNISSSFVIREHVNDDTVGLHTLPENVETGEYVCNGVNFDSKLSDTCICTMLSDDSTTTTATVNGGLYNGVFSGCHYILNNTNTAGINNLNQVLSDYDNAGKSDAVVGMFMAPTGVISGWDPESTIGIDLVESSAPYYWDYTSVTFNQSLDGYTPKNNKLKCWPYNYLLVSNNSGIEKVYRYEFFTNNKPNFRTHVSICPGCSIKLNPLNYKGITSGVAENEVEGIVGGKYSSCSWSTDVYTNWLTQNAVNIGVNTAGNVLNIASGMTSANPSGIVSGTMGIFNSISQVYQHSLTPDSARGNINSGDVNTGNKVNTFFYYKMSIKQEYAKCIDEYFTRYGYKVNRNKVPNITGRTYWNYIQISESDTLGTGEIPQVYLDEINKIARNGVTIWHDHANLGDYTLNNTIVS